MSKITLASHDTRADSSRRIGQTGLSGIGLGLERIDTSGLTTTRVVMTAVYGALSIGLLGAIGGAVKGGKALKWGGVSAAAGGIIGGIYGAFGTDSATDKYNCKMDCLDEAKKTGGIGSSAYKSCVSACG